MGKIKSFLIQGLAIVSALFGFIAMMRGKKIQRQEQQIHEQHRNAETIRAVQEQSTAVRAAEAQTVQENINADRLRQSVPDAERRTGRFGTAHRLRE